MRARTAVVFSAMSPVAGMPRSTPPHRRPGYRELLSEPPPALPPAPPPPSYYDGIDDFTQRVLLRQNKHLEGLGYRFTVVLLDDGQFYWHLWLKDNRINGGLSTTAHEARQDAERAVRMHAYAPVASRWDS